MMCANVCVTKGRGGVSFTACFTAYCVYVRPLLEFSSQIWSPHYKYLIDKIESVQRYFTNRLFAKKNYLASASCHTFLV